MKIDAFVPLYRRRLMKSATHPIEPRRGALAALLLLSGISPPRHHALPTHTISAHSGVSNRRI